MPCDYLIKKYLIGGINNYDISSLPRIIKIGAALVYSET